jgi:hypothetical protein
MICSDKEDLATAYQSARIFGNFDDNRRLTIYSPKEFEVGLRTIIDNNDQKYNIINNVDGVVRMPTELICNHINSFEYNSTVRTDSGDAIPVSEKSFCSKIKGDIRLKTMATTANRRKGNHVKGDNETLQEAVDRVYGPGHAAELVTECHSFDVEPPPVGKRKVGDTESKEFKKQVLEKLCDVVSGSKKRRILAKKSFSGNTVLKMRIAYSNANKAAFFSNPYIRVKSHIVDIAYDGNSCVLLLKGKAYFDEVVYDRIQAWHNSEGKIVFTMTVNNNIDAIEEAVVNVASGVIEVC